MMGHKMFSLRMMQLNYIQILHLSRFFLVTLVKIMYRTSCIMKIICTFASWFMQQVRKKLKQTFTDYNNITILKDNVP